MAEHFNGKYRSIHTTNGGGRLFLDCLLVFGLKCSNNLSFQDNVINFLQSRRELSDGWRAFDVHPLPEPLTSNQCMRFLTEIVENLARSLVNNDIPQSLRNDFDDRDFRLKWAGFSAEFYDLLKECAQFKLPNIELIFRCLNDEKAVYLSRLNYRQVDAKRNNRILEELELLDKIIVHEKISSPPPWLWVRFSDKADLLLKIGRTKAAIASLREGALYPDGDTYQALIDCAVTIEQRGRE